MRLKGSLPTHAPLEHELVAAIADQLPVGIYVARVPDGAFVYANDAFQRIMGMPPRADALGGASAAFYGIHTRDGERYPDDRLPFARVLREKASVTIDDIVVHRPDGTRVFVRAVGQPLCDTAGTVKQVVVAFSDMTEEVKVRSRADLAEGRLTHLLAHAPIILFAYDRRGVVTLTEGRGLEGLGFRPKELLGRSVFDLYAHDETLVSQARRVLSGETFTVIAQQGRMWLETTLTPIRGATGDVDGAIGVSIDVTERVTAQEHLVRTERLASMGTLSATIAHEINNPLTYVLGSLQLVAARLTGPLSRMSGAQELAGHVESAREGADRVRRIVRGLQAFSRQDDDRLEPTDVHAVIERAIEMTGNGIRHRARLVKDLERVPPALASELRLGQVVVNLLVNAAQAIPEGSPETNEIRVRTSCDEETGEVVVTVEDTGSGIEPDVLSRLFEPFFTTKALGEGSGLGLSICHGIVESFGGTIEVDSAVGKGTTFRLRLRASTSAPPCARREAPESEALPPRRGRLLIVDDDEKVGQSLAYLLRTDHDVEVSVEPRAIAERLLAGERFDVILCDLMMPGMTGMELHATVAKRAPEQADRFVFVTGGAFTPAATAFVGRVSNTVLMKPYDLRALNAALAVHLRR
ncbi:MAG TPA: ATP-binding protein [Polyangiaceae bacterium]|nr:ATP-binding protein [Polyangiaceae bacterium]